MVVILTANALVVRLVNMVIIVTSSVEMTALLDVIRIAESVLALMDTMVKHVIMNAVSDVIALYVITTENVYMDVELVSGQNHTVISLAQRTVWTKHVTSQHLIVLLVVCRDFMERRANYHAVPHVPIANVNKG